MDVIHIFVFVGCFLILVVGLLMCRQLLIQKKMNNWLKKQYDRYHLVLDQMECAIVEYDLKSGTLSANAQFEKMFQCKIFNGDAPVFQLLRELHPELGMEELWKDIDLAVERKETIYYDSFLMQDNRPRWIKILLIPIQDLAQNVTQVLGAVQDVTEKHMEEEKQFGWFRELPGGVHRCYLSEPIHMEYASDNLIKMLGYTRSEFDAVVGETYNYSNCIVPEDRQEFYGFVQSRQAEEGSSTCTYHIRTKSGEVRLISDTMESRMSASGIMYGYSVITDITEYEEKNSALEQELENTKQRLYETRLRISTSQMQPHFLYNALSSIREVVLEDPEYASDLIYDFTVHLRSCIKSMTSDDLIPLSQELESIKAYVEIEQMRFGDRLNVVYDIQAEEISVIPLGLQPLVENAIRHGIYQKGASGGTVWVSSRDWGDHWCIEVSDDGIGFEVDRIREEINSGLRDSTGLKNLIYRFKTIMNADVEIDSKPGTGTKISIVIPKGNR